MSSWLELLELTSGWELLAVVLAIAYVLLAIRQSIWCWPAAALSATIYSWLFLQSHLYMETLLQVFYVVMAIYGLSVWVKGRRQSSHAIGLPVSTRAWGWHVRWVGGLALVSVLVAMALTRMTAAEEVWLDTITTVFSLFATYLVARKVLENWLYWIVIDALYVMLFWSKGFYATAILFAVYTVMALIGYLRWRQTLQTNPALRASGSS